MTAVVSPPVPGQGQARPADQDERDRIATDLDATLFVEAGAGSGKTSALVDRVVSLVTTGRAELRSIAAITFTEKAAAELRDRVRHRLERRAEQAAESEVGDRCRQAIDQLDAAAIGTLHAFAQRVLSENPIEAGLPPRVEVLDEVTSEVEFERRWADFQDQLLADPALQRTLLLLFASGVKPQALRALAVEFDRNWDLVDEQVPATAPDPAPLREPLAEALTAVRRACAAAGHCRDQSDKLFARLGEIAAYADELATVTDELDLLDELTSQGALERPSFKVGSLGAKGKWSCDHEALRAEVAAAGEALELVQHDVAQACARRIATELRAFTLDAARRRRDAGQLAFHDLLVLSRSLVRHHQHGAAVRRRLHDRYQRLLLDEFQDTDPIQIELAVRIAAADPSSDEAGTLPWDQVPVADGQLFVVGDPKQSIYRFRRADISVFLAAKERFGAHANLVTLSTNFRTGAPVIDLVNETFARLMAEGEEVDVPVASQPDYVALRAQRAGPPVGPAVSVIARQPTEGSARDLRMNEAAEVARTITRAIAERWQVGTGDPLDPWRPARLGDITVLVPARTSLPFLEDALGDAEIAYRAESSSLVYVSQAVRDLLMALRAVDDPTDHLAVASALRSPLFGCGDDDLFTYRASQHGSWNYLADPPDTVGDGPVRSGLAYLRQQHLQRHWRSPAELLDGISRDRRLFELGFAEGRTRDVWRRLRFVIDQARAWSEATNGGLREYLQWVRRQSAEGSRVAEAVLPETDDDAVRIMTIHAAKGLEFPITILSGMSTQPQRARAPAEVVFRPDGRAGYRFGRHVTTDEFETWKPIDEQMDFHERIRLLYVACTRAQDHLVISLQRKERTSAPKPQARTNAELLVAGTGDRLEDLPDAGDGPASAGEAPHVSPPAPPVQFEEWEAETRRALRQGARPVTVAATALTAEGTAEVEDRFDWAPGLRKRPADLDLPPWLKGRYGTAVGRAVHATLQTIDLGTGEGLEAAVAAQCEAEAIVGRHATVTALVRAALGSPAVREAASGPHWREVYACVPTGGGRLLEGYVDLLYRSPAGLVVVDYKTAASSDHEELARRVGTYRLQGASYAMAVTETTAEAVARVVLLFLTPDGAVEIDLDHLEAAMAEVRDLVERGAEQTAD